MSLIVPGGRPVVETGPTAVSYAYIVATENDGNVVVLPYSAQTDVGFKRQASPDDTYGAISLIVYEDGVSGMNFLLDAGREPYESVFLVLVLPTGKVLLSPDIFVSLLPSREPSREQIFSSLAVLHANIAGVKTADMVMASLANQAAYAQRMSQDEALKQQLGL